MSFSPNCKEIDLKWSVKFPNSNTQNCCVEILIILFFINKKECVNITFKFITLCVQMIFILKIHIFSTKHPYSLNHLTLKIPDIDKVRLDVCERRRNSLNSSKKARHAPRRTRPQLRNKMLYSSNRKNWSVVAKGIPEIHNSCHRITCLTIPCFFSDP